MQETYCCRMAPSIGKLEAEPGEIWGTKDYDPSTDKELPTVFFGLYGLPDFFELWRHRGKRFVFWAGTDITHFKNGYWLDDEGEISVNPNVLARWLNENCEHWVENEVEAMALRMLGISPKVCPSFLGDVSKFQIEFKSEEKIRLYTSVSGDNFKLYGWDEIPELARRNPDIELHLYGNTIPFLTAPNVVEHGRVPKEQMNEEIKSMTGALRLTKFDGCSELIVKAMLWGQWPISPFIDYPYILKDLNELKSKRLPNIEGRNHYLKILNQFPWNNKKR